MADPDSITRPCFRSPSHSTSAPRFTGDRHKCQTPNRSRRPLPAPIHGSLQGGLVFVQLPVVGLVPCISSCLVFGSHCDVSCHTWFGGGSCCPLLRDREQRPGSVADSCCLDSSSLVSQDNTFSYPLQPDPTVSVLELFFISSLPNIVCASFEVFFPSLSSYVSSNQFHFIVGLNDVRVVDRL